MKISPRRLAFCVILLGVGSAAFAAPIAQMSCNSGAQSLSFNLSFFDLGVAQTATIGSAGGGGGSGKAVFDPLVVHTSFAPFQSLFNAATAATTFDTCTLTTRSSTGEAIDFVLKPAIVTKVDAIAQSASADAARTAYTRVTFEYGSAQVSSSSSTADDGGASPANDGWVKVKSQPSN
jgi:hypothetical protein